MRKQMRKLNLETLEVRVVPTSYYYWAPAGINTLFSNVNNWRVNGAAAAVAPGVGSVVVDEVTTQMNVNGNYTVDGIQVGDIQGVGATPKIVINSSSSLTVAKNGRQGPDTFTRQGEMDFTDSSSSFMINGEWDTWDTGSFSFKSIGATEGNLIISNVGSLRLGTTGTYVADVAITIGDGQLWMSGLNGTLNLKNGSLTVGAYGYVRILDASTATITDNNTNASIISNYGDIKVYGGQGVTKAYFQIPVETYAQGNFWATGSGNAYFSNTSDTSALIGGV